MAASRKSILYVGGLDDAVDERVLTAAFRPFGDVQSVLLPKDAASRQCTPGSLLAFWQASPASSETG